MRARGPNAPDEYLKLEPETKRAHAAPPDAKLRSVANTCVIIIKHIRNVVCKLGVFLVNQTNIVNATAHKTIELNHSYVA